MVYVDKVIDKNDFPTKKRLIKTPEIQEKQEEPLKEEVKPEVKPKQRGGRPKKPTS